MPVAFVPFGVDIDAFRPGDAPADLDVVSVGADPHRDFELLLAVARALPDVRFLVVASAEHARSLGERPPNVSVETDLPFDEMRDRLGRARVVALPVRENSYSGATTVLLQAMALGEARRRDADGRDRQRATGSSTARTSASSVPGDADDVRGGASPISSPTRRATRLGEHARDRRDEPLVGSLRRRARGSRHGGAEALRLPLRLGPAAAPPACELATGTRRGAPQVPGQLVGSARAQGCVST